MKKIKGTLHISRPSYGDGRKMMMIQIDDDTSALQILEMELSYDDFVMALTSSMGYGEIQYNDNPNIGKKLEVKEEAVTFPKGVVYGEKLDPTEFLKPYEVNGWIARREDIYNHHHSVGAYSEHTCTQRVSFKRWV